MTQIAQHVLDLLYFSIAQVGSPHATPVKHKKQDSKMSWVQMKTSRSARDVQVKKSENRDLQDKELTDCRPKNKGTRMEELERCFHQRKLNALLFAIQS